MTQRLSIKCWNPVQAHKDLMTLIWPQLKANLTAGKRMVLEMLARRVDAITKGTRDLLVAEGLGCFAANSAQQARLVASFDPEGLRVTIDWLTQIRDGRISLAGVTPVDLITDASPSRFRSHEVVYTEPYVRGA